MCGVIPAVIIEQIMQPNLQVDPPADASGQDQHEHLLCEVGGDPGAIIPPPEGHRRCVDAGDRLPLCRIDHTVELSVSPITHSARNTEVAPTRTNPPRHPLRMEC